MGLMVWLSHMLSPSETAQPSKKQPASARRYRSVFFFIPSNLGTYKLILF